MYKICGTSEEIKNEENGIIIDETEDVIFNEVEVKNTALNFFNVLAKKMEDNKLFKDNNPKNPIIYICLKENGKIIKEKSVYKIKKSLKNKKVN